MLKGLSALFQIIWYILQEWGREKLRQEGRNEVTIEIERKTNEVEDAVDRGVSDTSGVSDDEVISG